MAFMFLLYPVGAWLLLNWVGGGLRSTRNRGPILFGLYNVGGAFLVCYLTIYAQLDVLNPETKKASLMFTALIFALYLGIVLLSYWLLRTNRQQPNIYKSPAFIFPLVVLVLIKYLPLIDHPVARQLRMMNELHLAAFFVGLSYLTFRLCRLVQELQVGSIELPSVWNYLSFAFFVPTLTVGPISPYNTFITSLTENKGQAIFRSRALLRILVGFTKYIFLANVFSQISYQGFLRDGHPHVFLDLVIAMFAYAPYLYCNFSGVCDMAIGVSGLIGIEVMENFNEPFTARNFQEFWTRWHISLSVWFRDLMFTPMVKALGRIAGTKRLNHVVALTIMSVFIVIGIWHGAGLNYLIFGISQGAGVVTVHYWNLWLKKRMGAAKFVAFRERPFLINLGRIATFSYFAATLFLFANSWDQMVSIVHSIR